MRDTPPSREQPAKLDLPPDIRWSCVQCGRSCEDWTEVGIEPDEAARLQRLPLFDPDLPLDPGLLPHTISEREPDQRVLRFAANEDGGACCVLRNASRLCAVHVAHGEEAKPATCRAFPFWFVATPDGELACLSFACTAVLHDHGDPVADQADTVRGIAGLAGVHREPRGRDILLAPGIPFRWREYLVLERELSEILVSFDDLALALFRQAEVIRAAASMPPPERRESSALAAALTSLVVDVVGMPPRFAPVQHGLGPLESRRVLRRWIAHRLWRKDLLRGGEILLAHSLLLAEVALAVEWATSEQGGIGEAIAQVERGLVVHSDFIARLNQSGRLRDRVRRLLLAPRLAASLVARISALL